MPIETMSAVRDYVAAFLDENMRGQSASALLRGASTDYPDATVISSGKLVLPTDESTNPAAALAKK